MKTWLVFDVLPNHRFIVGVAKIVDDTLLTRTLTVRMPTGRCAERVLDVIPPGLLARQMLRELDLAAQQDVRIIDPGRWTP